MGGKDGRDQPVASRVCRPTSVDNPGAYSAAQVPPQGLESSLMSPPSSSLRTLSFATPTYSRLFPFLRATNSEDYMREYKDPMVINAGPPGEQAGVIDMRVVNALREFVTKKMEK